MKRRVMVDLNVILDVLENRAEWVAASAGVCALCAERKIVGFVPSHALTTICYIVRKRGGKTLADKAVDWVLSVFSSPILRSRPLRRLHSCGTWNRGGTRNACFQSFLRAVGATCRVSK